ASHSRSAFLRKDQDIRMWTAAGFGIIAGMSLLLILPRFLPFSADSHVASLVMGRDRVSAGYAMIEAVDPFTVKKMKWGGQFYDAGGGEILACLENARQTRERPEMHRHRAGAGEAAMSEAAIPGRTPTTLDRPHGKGKR
ncbi:DUF6118 family protein, partial [Sinorhizobium meliloti]|uniref:DUF6118 family protein n=1 Tax=Rhizobium meliloti TaxID=382 RepID=UPI001F212580